MVFTFMAFLEYLRILPLNFHSISRIYTQAYYVLIAFLNYTLNFRNQLK